MLCNGQEGVNQLLPEPRLSASTWLDASSMRAGNRAVIGVRHAHTID
jgi:hypothetical protein